MVCCAELSGDGKKSIASENQRYYKVVNGVSSGSAPILGMQIEAWAYSTLTSATGEYAIYQMYIGNNNTNNFDVEPNHFYNLRTTINADINSAKNDERIRHTLSASMWSFTPVITRKSLEVNSMLHTTLLVRNTIWMQLMRSDR